MAEDAVTEQEMSDLISRAAEATEVFIRGDMSKYFELVNHASDFTLMAPLGGEPRRGFDDSEEALRALTSYFRGGDGELDVIQTYASGNLAVLVGVERQHGEVGDLPDQDWSLRVTLVFRREGADWQLVHRHADALLQGVTLEQLAPIARGEAPG
jgi:ketosteroid isomerase-like protein